MYHKRENIACTHFWIHSNGIDYDLSRRMNNELKKRFAEYFHGRVMDYELVLSVDQNVSIDQANYVELSNGYNSYIQNPLEYWSTAPIAFKEVRDNILK